MFLSNKISRLFGLFANKAFAPFLQRYINKIYVDIFKIDLSDFEPYYAYKTLNALFTRELKKEREIRYYGSNIVSPTDSLIMQSGNIEKGMALQIKGFSYRANDLINEDINFDGYKYINLYLSPKDYHRYHAICDLEVLEARYFSGRLLPVNKPSLQKNKYLFMLNERVVLKLRFSNNEIGYYIAVGALNVGKMIINFDDRIKSNAGEGDKTYVYKNPIKLKAGDEIGRFEMGSTIVLFFKGDIKVKNNDIVKMGQDIADLKI